MDSMYNFLEEADGKRVHDFWRKLIEDDNCVDMDTAAKDFKNNECHPLVKIVHMPIVPNKILGSNERVYFRYLSHERGIKYLHGVYVVFIYYVNENKLKYVGDIGLFPKCRASGVDKKIETIKEKFTTPIPKIKVVDRDYTKNSARFHEAIAKRSEQRR